MKPARALVLLLVIGFASSPAMAIDLRNLDTAAHSVSVTSTAMTRDVAMPARSGVLIICVGTCTFEVPGVGRVEAQGEDVVTIRDGVIEREPEPRVAPTPAVEPEVAPEPTAR